MCPQAEGIVAYWDDYDKVPYAFPHVYDYMEGADAVSREYRDDKHRPLF